MRGLTLELGENESISAWGIHIWSRVYGKWRVFSLLWGMRDRKVKSQSGEFGKRNGGLYLSGEYYELKSASFSQFSTKESPPTFLLFCRHKISVLVNSINFVTLTFIWIY